jgi:hypothetical protein
MQEVVMKLKATISPEVIICNFNEDKKKSFSPKKYELNSESRKATIDINNDLHINNSLMLKTISDLNTISKPNTMPNIASLHTNMFRSSISSQNHLDNSTIASRASLSSIILIESIYSTVIDNLIDYIIKKHDRGITFIKFNYLLIE